MGIWNIEFDPALTGNTYELVNFNGDVFAFCYNGTGAGIWQRTPPNWTQTIGRTSRGAVWNGLMWWGTDQFGTPGSEGRYISRSTDGVNWITDIDFGPGVYSYWSAMGGYGSYLYAAERVFQGVPGNTFQRRDTVGNWVAIPPVNPDINNGQDTIGFGSYVYWCDGSDCDRYQTAWEAEPTLDGDCDYFTVHNGILFAMTTYNVYRLSGGVWVSELSVGVPWGFGGASEGADGNLYVCANNGATSRVYVRSGSVWTLHSTAAAVFLSAIADANGNLFATTNSCEFWAYTPSFDVSPIGGGLPPQAMDCDGDGNALYVGVYNAAAQPILVKVPLPLTPTAMGAAVFNPGAGNAINVKCSAVGQKLAISGRLSAGGNDSVQTSEDGGGTWTDIAPNWGDTVQPLLVDPDTVDEVYVALDAAQDLDETVDGGTTWIQRNAAVGYSPGAMAKLPDGDELVAGNDAGNRIDYSPNRGQTLQNVTGVFVGAVAALEVA